MVFQRPQSVSAIFFIHFPNRGFTRPRRRQLGTAATNQKQAQGSVSPVAGASAHCPGAPASGPAGVAIPAETRRIGNRRSAVAQIDFRFGCGADIPVCRFWGLSSSRIPRQTISFGRRSWKTSQPAGSKARPAIWTTRQRRALPVRLRRTRLRRTHPENGRFEVDTCCRRLKSVLGSWMFDVRCSRAPPPPFFWPSSPCPPWRLRDGGSTPWRADLSRGSFIAYNRESGAELAGKLF